MNEETELLVRLWEKTIDVQMHFNEIEMKVRNFAVTVIAAFMGAIGVSTKEEIIITVGGNEYPLAAFLALSALVIWFAFYLIDRHWYHRLLYGSVAFGIELEKKLSSAFPNKVPAQGLTETIGAHSPIKFNFLGYSKEIHTSGKYWFFYGAGAFILLGLALVLL